MTAAENISIADGLARAKRPFRFFVEGADGRAEFFPGAGTSLRFANRDIDTLMMPMLPVGLVTAGNSVSVEYNGVRVFSGTAEKIVDMRGRGDERVQTVTCQGPWGKLNRYVFRQTWSVRKKLKDDDGNVTGTSVLSLSSPRVVLNQDALGAAQNVSQTLREIIQYAAAKCGFSYRPEDVGDDATTLPPDETHGITCAGAIIRELRFHPRKIVRFDYSREGLPAVVVSDPSGSQSSYAANAPATSRRYEYTAHPISCVDIYWGDVDVQLDADGREIVGAQINHQFYPQDENLLDDIDCLHAYLPVAPGSASTSWKSFDCVVEELPNFAQDKDWWMEKHPRLKGIAPSQFTIIGAGERNGLRQFDKIAKATADELKEAGLEFEVETFRIHGKIDTSEDIEEDVILEMTFLMTNGDNRTYTWQTGSSSSSGETLPAGLAKAVFDQRSGSLLNEEISVRLGAEFPVLGDVCDGLLLQEFEVDCHDVTARLHYGQPEYLSIEDMRDLLGGFRQRAFAENERIEDVDEPGPGEEIDVGGIPPLSTSDWSPGIKAKTTLKTSSGGSSATGGSGKSPSSIVLDADKGGGRISLETDTLTRDQHMRIIAWSMPYLFGSDGTNETKPIYVLATDGFDFGPFVDYVNEIARRAFSGGGGGGGEGDGDVTSGVKFTGTDGNAGDVGHSFTFRSAYDSNVEVKCSEKNIEVGVYYK